MDRRTFLSWVGMGWIASSLPVALAACTSSSQSSSQSSSPASPQAASLQSPIAASPSAAKQSSPASSPSPSQSPADGFVKVGTTAELEAGAIVLPKSPVGPLAVVRSEGVLAAVNPTCTHQGCVVAWQNSEYVCPCHQAKFSATGAVIGQGPAKVPLKVYQVRIEGSDVLVKA